MPVLISFLLGLPRAGLQSELLAFFDHALGREDCVSKSALCQARSQLDPGALRGLLHAHDALAGEHFALPQSMRWHGLRVLALDSTVLRVPDVPECADFFGGMKTSCGRFRPLARASALWDVARGCFVDATVGGYRRDDRSLAMAHLPHLSSSDLLVMDRGYPSRQWLGTLQQAQVPFCVRMCDLNWTLVRNFARSGQDDAIAVDKGAKGQPELRLRLIRHCLPSGRMLLLATNVFDASIGPAQFAQLYRQRWQIEEAFKQVKARMQVENFSGVLPHVVQQDLYAALLRSNCAAWLMLAERLQAEQQGRTETVSQTNYGTWQHKHNRCVVGKMLGHHLAGVLLALGDWQQRLLRLWQRLRLSLAKVVTKVGRTNPRAPRKVRIAEFHPAYKGA